MKLERRAWNAFARPVPADGARPRRLVGGLRGFVTVVCALAVTLMSVSPVNAQDGDSEDLSKRLYAQQHDGAQLVRGLFFLDGPVVKLIPGLVDVRQQVIAQGGKIDTAKIDQAVATMQKDDPAFVVQFAADMTSGDHVRVDAALMAAAPRVRTAVEKVIGHPIDTTAAQAITLFWGPVVVVAAAAFAWAAAWITTAAFGAVWFWGDAGGKDALDRDRFVDHLATHLAA